MDRSRNPENCNRYGIHNLFFSYRPGQTADRYESPLPLFFILCHLWRKPIFLPKLTRSVYQNTHRQNPTPESGRSHAQEENPKRKTVETNTGRRRHTIPPSSPSLLGEHVILYIPIFSHIHRETRQHTYLLRGHILYGNSYLELVIRRCLISFFLFGFS